MSENEIGLREGRAQFGDLVNRAEYAGEITYVTRHGRRVAAIVPLNRISEEPAVSISTYTLISATPGDAMPDGAVEISDPDAPTTWDQLPAAAKSWAQDQGYSYSPDKLLYIAPDVPDIAGAPAEAWPTYILNISTRPVTEETQQRRRRLALHWRAMSEAQVAHDGEGGNHYTLDNLSIPEQQLVEDGLLLFIGRGEYEPRRHGEPAEYGRLILAPHAVELLDPDLLAQEIEKANRNKRHMGARYGVPELTITAQSVLEYYQSRTI